MPTNLTLARNGQIAVNTTADPLTAQIDKYLSEADNDYINKQNASIAKLNAAEVKLDDEIKKLAAKLAESPEAEKLKKLKAKRKMLVEQRREKGHKVAGVIERAMGAAHAEPGQTLAEAMTGSLPTPTRKALKAGGAPAGGRGAASLGTSEPRLVGYPGGGGRND